MAGVNKAIIIGNLGSDPELKYTNSGTPVCRLSIATTRTWKNQQTGETQSETEWHRATVWGKTAEHCNNYLSKGRQVYVEGRLRTSSYEKEDYPGLKFYTTEIVADQVQFLGSKGGSEGGGNQGGNQGGNRSSGGQVGGQQNPPNRSPSEGFDDDDDIPF